MVVSLKSDTAGDARGTPKGGYFARVAGQLDSPERLAIARRDGRRTVAIVGVTLPEELVRACGGVPISLTRLVGRIEGGNETLPRDACVLARTGFELLANHWIPAGLIDAVLVAGGCDWSSRLGDLLGERVPVWPLNVARTVRKGTSRVKGKDKRGAAVESRLGSLDSVLQSLEELTDLPLTPHAFEIAHQRVAVTRALRDQLDRLRAGSPPVIRASKYYQIAGALDLADPELWTRNTRSVLERRQARAGGKKKRPRVVLSGCPSGFPDRSLVRLIEQVGMQIVGEEFGAHGDRLAHTARPHGGRRAILRWVAEKLAVDEPQQDNGENSLMSLLDQRNANGVVRIQYRGCAVTAMGTLALQRKLAARGTPLLPLEIEQLPLATEALRTRLEAFRERLLEATRE
jgi:benzoyl-CoA reductase/2-hydroxyglutaryl-CoA dehydratase subunit BcrC/BadD/HgdB